MIASWTMRSRARRSSFSGFFVLARTLLSRNNVELCDPRDYRPEGAAHGIQPELLHPCRKRPFIDRLQRPRHSLAAVVRRRRRTHHHPLFRTAADTAVGGNYLERRFWHD